MSRLIAILLLPLSMLPIALIAVPRVAAEIDDFEARYVDREPHAAPEVAAPRVPPVPAHPGAVPVLVYHGIGDDGTRWTVRPRAFAEQLAALDAAGYETVSAEQYARFVRGEPVRLPERPVLITFDDGRLDSYRGADAVLESHGFRATMFAIASAAAEGSERYLSPDELSEMADSGRWDVQFHAGAGHRRVRGADGRMAGYYATRLPGESLAGWRGRVTRDLDAGLRSLRERVPETGDELFALPYSDAGRDPQLRRALRAELERRFDAAFVQRAVPRFSTPRPRGYVGRFEPHAGSTAADVLAYLRAGARRATSNKEA